MCTGVVLWIESHLMDPNYYGTTGLYYVAGGMVLHVLVHAILLHPSLHHKILVTCLC